MARYTGPKWRVNRRENYSVYESTDKWKKRAGHPGVHPQSRNRPTEYAVQFREKQKVKNMYGMLEKQFRRFFELASKSEGNTGFKLLQLLELRLDNVVYRMKLANTRIQARQLVSHGHIEVNGSKVDIPSYIVKVGDIVSLGPISRKKEFIKFRIEENKLAKEPAWIDMQDQYSCLIKSEPIRDDIDMGINEQLIVELYSK